MICLCLKHVVFLQKELMDNPKYSYAVSCLDVHYNIVSHSYLYALQQGEFLTPVSDVVLDACFLTIY